MREHLTAALPEEERWRCTKINTGSGPAINFWVRDVRAVLTKLYGDTRHASDFAYEGEEFLFYKNCMTGLQCMLPF